MANQKFNLGMQDVYQAGVNLLTDDIRLLLAKSTWTPNLATNHYVSDITAGAITARSGSMTGKSFSGLTFLAANVTFTLVAAGASDFYVILYKWTGSDATSPLLVKYDSGQNLPVTPIGGDITVQADPTLGWFQL